MRTKVRVGLYIGFCLLVLTCKKSNQSPIDLVLELPQAQSAVSIENDPIPYHWKKNPGRLTALPKERKWENTQITFNTNKETFLNHSVDSLFFPPGQSYTYKISPGEYEFRSLIGMLGERTNSSKTSGVFSILSDGKKIWSWNANSKAKEVWFPESINFKLENQIELRWESESTYLYLGEPLLLPKQLSEDWKENHSFMKEILGSKKPPSVILIVIDSARRDFFGSYGYPYSVTPVMDRLSNESVFFEFPYANGNWTKPSMMSFFHSEYSSNLGLGNSWFSTKPYQRKVYYGKKRDNLAKSFRETGYYTKSIMNNVFFLDYTTVGLDLGFHNLFQVGKDIEDTPILTDHAISFVEEYKSVPYFLHFNLNTPHASYSPPDFDMEIVKKIVPSQVFNKYESPIKRYLGEMHYTDREVGRLIQKLKDLGTYDETMIIVTGDHGELFSAHHDYSYHFIMQTRFGHGETHYEEEIAVPYFIKLPKSITKKSFNLDNKQIRIPGQSSLMSLAPTVLGLLDSKPKINSYKGVDYSHCIRDASDCPRENFIYTEGRMSESVRTEAYKYIRRYPGFTTVRRTIEGEPHTMAEELYDLKKDIEEKVNLAILPEGKNLLTQAREDFRKENFLKRNSIRFIFPPCDLDFCRESVSLQIQGSVYDWEIPDRVVLNSNSAKSATMLFENNPSLDQLQTREVKIQTVNPEFGIQFFYLRNGVSRPVRLGRYGLESKISFWNFDDLILSERTPIGWENSPLPWIYNDGAFSGSVESEYQKEMGKEVKKILETWGYIHE